MSRIRFRFLFRAPPVLPLSVHRRIRFATIDKIPTVIVFQVYSLFHRIAVVVAVVVVPRFGQTVPGAEGIFLEAATMSLILPPVEYEGEVQEGSENEEIAKVHSENFDYHSAQVVTVELNMKKQFNTVSTISGSSMIGMIRRSSSRIFDNLAITMTWLRRIVNFETSVNWYALKLQLCLLRK